ncbi:hypothetical protein A2U01_0025277 [Trifolium medium]|uniref:Uncharacterized protein n=1 Tax=Trifolium medium TaxID=97028 RepID=A0A392NXP8_9FABA|nr:hypothetical protein [Trifolium medium]
MVRNGELSRLASSHHPRLASSTLAWRASPDLGLSFEFGPSLA